MAPSSVTGRASPGVPFGCVGSILAVVAVTVAAVIIGITVFIVVGVLVALGLVALAVRGLVSVLSPSGRARRDDVRGAEPIDATATETGRRPEQLEPPDERPPSPP